LWQWQQITRKDLNSRIGSGRREFFLQVGHWKEIKEMEEAVFIVIFKIGGNLIYYKIEN
jgi:hypothetical protein